jgi:hypothetical protein
VRTVRVLLVGGALALSVMLLTACGGSANRARVEASLQRYLSTLDPQACFGARVCEQGAFPIGFGAPHVKAKSCKKVHSSAWRCVITYPPGSGVFPVNVAVEGSGEVYSAAPVGAPPLPPATVYQGGPGQALP